MKKRSYFLTGIVILGMFLFVTPNKDDIEAPKIEFASVDSGNEGIWDYTGTSYYLGTQDIFPEGVFWDGTNWWMIGSDSDKIHKYSSDWSYTGVSYDISGQFTTPTDIFWDGSNWWGLGDGTADRVYKYDSNWIYTGISHYIGGQEPAAKGIFWDGTNWWLVGLHNRVIYQFSSSWSYTGTSYYIGEENGYPSDLFWDGVNWWVSGIYSDATHKYNSDWSYTGISYDTSGQDNYPTDIFWDGVNWWMLGYGNSRVFEYGDLNNEFENTLPDQNPFLIYIIVGFSCGILGISLIFIYVLKIKNKKTQTLVREIIDNKKIFCPICFTELKQGEKKCLNCENALKENKMREKLIRKKQKSTVQRNKKEKGRDLKRFKNMMLRETIGSFLAPLLIPLLLLTYDFPEEVNIIFIVVVSIISPLVGLLFLRAYLKANAKYKESLSQVSSSFRTKQIDSNSFKKKERPISEVHQDFNFSRPINEVSKLKIEEIQSNSSITDNIDKELRVKSYTCKNCGKQLIKKASYCPYCGK